MRWPILIGHKIFKTVTDFNLTRTSNLPEIGVRIVLDANFQISEIRRLI